MAETIDQQFIEYIVKSLVSQPDQVRVERRIDERGVLLELYVAPDDLGRVIGRNGGTAKSVRTLLRALGVKNDARYNLKIIDTNGVHDPQPAQTTEQPVASDQAQASDSAQSQPTDSSQPQAEVPMANAPTETPEPSAETVEEPPEPEESKVAKQRKEIEEIAGDLDI